MSEKDSEAERRRKVAEEKVWGALIESIERSRKNPIAKSLVFRIVFFYGAIEQFSNLIKIMSSKINPVKTVVPTFTRDQANVLINTYNDIIHDIHSNFRRRDAAIDQFSDFKLITEPTYDEVAKILYRMGVALYQALGYLVRWM